MLIALRVHACLCVLPVTTCGRATEALELLREDKDKFDLVISDVYMPDMDGFKLLELVGLEMDLPVISKLLLISPFPVFVVASAYMYTSHKNKFLVMFLARGTNTVALFVSSDLSKWRDKHNDEGAHSWCMSLPSETSED